MRRLLLAVSVMVLIPATASAGGGGFISFCPGFASGNTISMLDSCFSGTAHFAPAGSTLTISNDGELPHTFTAVDGSFDSGMVQAGEVFELTIDEPGVFHVFCTLHGTAEGEGMAGVLLVGEVEPPAVGAGPDKAAIKQAVIEANQALAEEIDRQARVIEGLGDGQEGLVVGLAELSRSRNQGPPTSPAVVAVQTEPGMLYVLVPALGGLAAGLAIAMVVLARRLEGGPIR